MLGHTGPEAGRQIFFDVLQPLALSDGALLILTMSVFTDRNGVSYGQDISIQPDVLVDGDPTAEGTDWLLDHPACRR